MLLKEKSKQIVYSLVIGMILPFTTIYAKQPAFTLSYFDKLTVPDSTKLSDSLKLGNTFKDNRPLSFPDSVAFYATKDAEESPQCLILYLKSKLHTQDGMIRAIYTWISHNINYNIYTTFKSRNEEINEKKEIREVWKNRKGTCREYAILFRYLAETAGFAAFIINGYNKEGKTILPNPHQWCAAQINGKWYLFDPTWGAGYVENYQFIPALNYRYFMLSPEQIQQTHMPFDPLWQFKEHPLSYDEFDTGKSDSLHLMPFFNWKDTLNRYLKQDTLQRLNGIKTRIMSNGNKNELVNYTLHLVEANIQIAHSAQIINAFNQAMNLQCEAVDSINIFIRYRNSAFEPLFSEERIKLMVDIPEKLINQADSTINTIREVSPKYREPILKLRQVIIDVASQIYTQKLFLKQYFSIPPKQRKSLFRR